MGILLFLKAINPRTWMIIGLSAAILWLGLRIYQEGVSHAREQASRELLEKDKDDMKQQSAILAQALSRTQTQLDATTTVINNANSTIAALNGQLVNLRQQATAATAAVAHRTDPELVGDIRTRVGLRTATDPSPLQPEELRAIDVTLAKSPFYEQEINKLGDKVAALETKSKTQDEQLALVQEQTRAWQSYSEELFKNYKTAYGLAQPRIGLWKKIITLGFAKQKKLNLPSPEDIKKPPTR